MERMNKIGQEINTLLVYFKHSKAFFRYIGDNYVGKTELPPYNIALGYQQFIMFNNPITKDFQERHNSVGHYLNQNILIRLFAILNSNDVVGDHICPK